MCLRAVAGLRTARDGPRRNLRLCPGRMQPRTSVSDLARGRGAAGRASSSELDAESDFVLVDAGSGLGAGVGMLAAATDQAVIVSTPEPTSIADAHAAISRFAQLARRAGAGAGQSSRVRRSKRSRCSTDSSPRAASSRERWFHRWAPVSFGIDPHVPLAVRSRRRFVTAFPSSAASRGIRRIARAS